MSRAGLALALAAGALLSGEPARAQGWTVDLGAGRSVHDAVAARAAQTTASLGLRWEAAAADRWLYLTGGLPVSDGGPGWGAGGAGLWLPLAGTADVTLGVRSGVHLFGYGATEAVGSGGGATAELAPTLVLTRGPLRAEAYAGAVGVGDTEAPDGWRTLADAGGRLAASPVPGLVLVAEGRWLRDQDAAYPYVGASAEWTGPRMSAWVFAGRWTSDLLADVGDAYGGGVSLRVAPVGEVSASWQQDPTDPLYWNAPRRTWSVLLSRPLGPMPRAARTRPVPAVPLAPARTEGGVEISVPARGLDDAPVVLGDFSGWEPVAMARAGGRWTVRLPLRPGTYHYGFRKADGEWFVPDGVAVVDDGFGGTSAVLVVQ